MNTRTLNKVAPITDRLLRENVLLERFDVIRKLSDGYIHEIRGRLAVIMGQSEIIESSHEETVAEIMADQFLRGASSIAGAADQISSLIAELRTICTIGAAGFDRPIVVSSLIKKLPRLIRGYARQIKDSRNVGLSLELSVPDQCECVISYADVFDYICPLVMRIMEEALCSGRLNLSAARIDGACCIGFSISRPVLDDISLETLIMSVYKHHQIDVQSPGQILLDDGAVRVEFEEGKGSTLSLTLYLNQHRTS